MTGHISFLLNLMSFFLPTRQKKNLRKDLIFFLDLTTFLLFL